jgi:hypothetical protein
MIAAGRACRAIDLGRPFYATGLLVASFCQISAGAALVASKFAVYEQLGTVIIVGSALGSGIGLFVAPGLAVLMRGFLPHERGPQAADNRGEGS